MPTVSLPVAMRPPARGLPRPAAPNLRGFTRAELEEWVARELGGPRFRAGQIFGWLHRSRVDDPQSMTNLAQADRATLASKATWTRLRIDAAQQAVDGTRKLRLRGALDEPFESVLIPNPGRGWTQCVSSMVGCSLTCRFCATAQLGFVRNLATWEIVDQVYQAQDLLAREAQASGARWSDRITNLVFMGMGEPLHNYGQVTAAIRLLVDPQGAGLAARRITVSSAGLVPAIERFARDPLGAEVGLAISLNATTDAVRDRVMPINTKWNIATLLDAVRGMPSEGRRRVTFEYVLLADVNDGDDDAARLFRLVGEFDAHINVIPFNPHPGTELRRPSPMAVQRFVAQCRAHGLQVHVRTPRGDDIAAACGQLALEASP